ncbi:hypothetical protein EAF00_008424 [Botryotinia globosa]|nr:hypothetical protein EAF00_008424 [Botryotinia globosa]
MRTSLLSISTLLTLPLTTLADFHYGYSDYTITTATGRENKWLDRILTEKIARKTSSNTNVADDGQTNG